MKHHLESFAKRLTHSVVLTVLATMAVISVIVLYMSAAIILMFNRNHYSDIMDKANGNMALIMSKVEVSAENIIDELTWHLATPEVVSSTLEYELNTNRHVYGCGIGFVPDYFPQEGRWFEPYALNSGDGITMKTIGSETHDYFNAEWYTRGLESPEGVWSNPYLDEDGAGTVLCTFSRMVKEPEGKIAGVFGADISLEGLSSMILENIKKENKESAFVKVYPDEADLQIYCFIIGPNGDYIVHPDKERILKTSFYDFATGKGADNYKELGDDMRAGNKGERIVNIDGIKSDVYFSPLLHSGWSMGIVVPIKRLLLPGLLTSSMILTLILLGLLIVFLTCQRTIKKTSKPLIQLAESTKEMATGNFDTELPDIKTNDEIRLLRDSFDNMQKSLAQYVQELTDTTAQKAAMDNELGVARNIQMSMLPIKWPAFPERDDLDIYGSLTPAKAVGGDLYDFRLSDGKLFFCIGDVSGKGVPAALVMSVMSSMFRTLSASEDSPEKILNTINSSMSERNESMMFVTLLVGALDLSTGELKYSNAGHNAPVLISGGEAHMLDVDPNVPVGIASDWHYSSQCMTLSPGTVLFLYTDGLTEATESNGEMFREERVLENLSGLDGHISAEGIVSHMLEAVGEFVGDAEQSDDLTMLVLQINPASEAVA
ncbi:MAG: SpoIIE family protein phosphatase [Bacteroidales bacterium]|nr:SpoIIE family protein phosphatase [Bacteroidales bacterium]